MHLNKSNAEAQSRMRATLTHSHECDSVTAIAFPTLTTRTQQPRNTNYGLSQSVNRESVTVSSHLFRFLVQPSICHRWACHRWVCVAKSPQRLRRHAHRLPRISLPRSSLPFLALIWPASLFDSAFFTYLPLRLQSAVLQVYRHLRLSQALLMLAWSSCCLDMPYLRLHAFQHDRRHRATTAVSRGRIFALQTHQTSR